MVISGSVVQNTLYYSKMSSFIGIPSARPLGFRFRRSVDLLVAFPQIGVNRFRFFSFYTIHRLKSTSRPNLSSLVLFKNVAYKNGGIQIHYYSEGHHQQDGRSSQVERMVSEAEKFAKEDKEKRDAIDTKNQADSIVYQTEKQLKELGDKVPAPVKEKVESKLTELKEAISGGSTS